MTSQLLGERFEIMKDKIKENDIDIIQNMLLPLDVIQSYTLGFKSSLSSHIIWSNKLQLCFFLLLFFWLIWGYGSVMINVLEGSILHRVIAQGNWRAVVSTDLGSWCVYEHTRHLPSVSYKGYQSPLATKHLFPTLPLHVFAAVFKGPSVDGYASGPAAGITVRVCL